MLFSLLKILYSLLKCGIPMLILVCVYYTPVHSMKGEDTRIIIHLGDVILKHLFFQNQ